MLWVIIIIVAFLLSKGIEQGGVLYYHDPGLAEYIASFTVAGLLVMGIVAVLKRLL